MNSISTEKKSGTSMQPTTRRAHQFARGFFLITAVLLAQHLAVSRLAADTVTPACPCSIWSASIDPGPEAPDTSAVNLGIKFQSDVDGYIKAIRFYKHPDNTGTHIGYLWSSTGTQLGSATFTNETATGWQEVALSPAVPITANTTYVASYYAPNSHWPHNLDYFQFFGVDSPPLHVAGGSGNNGVYAYGSAGLFPNNSPLDHPTNYMVDVVFEGTSAPNTTPPTITSITPANGATGVDPNTNIDIHFSKEIDASSLNGITVQLLDPSNAVIAATVTYPQVASTPTATIIPTPVLALSTTYTLVVKSGSSGVKDLAGHALASDFTATFSTAATAPTYGCPCTVWTAATDNGGGVQGPDNVAQFGGVNLGLKFQSNASGYIKGIRFYKQPSNTGTHTAFLWNASGGPALASATFSGESATGWQEIRFLSPVAITRHTTYIAAYHTEVGYWAQTRPYFETSAFVNTPLRASQNFFRDPNSVFAYGAAGVFPNQDPNDAPNYWIDFIFDTSASDGTGNNIAPTITSANVTTFTVGSAGTFTVTTSGSPTPSIAVNGALPSGVTFVDNGNGTGTLAGTPASGSGGTYALTFTATNTAGNAQQNFTLTVNEATSITTAAANTTVCDGSNATFTAAASGYPAPALQWRVSTDGGSTFTDIGGATTSPLTFPASLSANGNRYRAHFTNSSGFADTTAVLTVNPTPAVPTITAPAFVTTNSTGNSASGPAGATTYAWSIVNGTITSATNIQSITFTAGATGNVTLGLTVTNASSCSASNSATIAINHVPTAVADSYTVAEGGTLTVPAGGVLSNDTDADSDTLTAIKLSNPAHGTVTLNANGSFTYVHDGSETTSDSFTYKANDGKADSNVATVSITITPVNDPPVAVNNTYTTNEDTALNVPAPGVLGNDTDVDSPASSLTAVLVAGPSHGTLTLNPNGSFTYTPAANYNGSDSFTYKANDGTADSNVATVTINITAVNDAPVAVADAYSTNEDTALNVAAPGVLGNDTDVDGNTLTAILGTTVPLHGTLTFNANGSFTYTPAANYNGSDSFTYHANDGTVNSSDVTVSLTINPVNDPPTVLGDNSNTYENLSVKIVVLANDSDIDGDTLTVSSVTQGAHGSIAINADNSLQYTPALDYNGTDSFTYTASDGHGGTGTATVNVTIRPVNSPPTANADSYGTTPNTTLNVPAPGLLANDTDPENDPLTAALTVNPSHGSATVNSNGSFAYTPAANYTGIDTFKYKAADSGLVTSTDDTTMDFLAGTIDGCTAVRLGNGDVMLTPASPGMVEAFTGTALPNTWSSNIQSGGSLTVGSGLLTLNGATARFDTQYQPAAGQPKVVEVVATFAA